MKKLKRILAVWQVLGSCYLFLVVLSMIPPAVLLQTLLKGYPIFSRGVVSTKVFIAAELILVFTALSLRMILIKKSSHKTFRSPCEIILGLHKEEEIVSILREHICMKTLAEDCWYGKERLRRRQLRVFVFSFKEKELNNDLDYVDSCVKRVSEKTKFPSYLTVGESKKMGRIQIIIFDEVPPSVLHSIAVSTENNIEKPEYVVNILYGLNKGVLYIPFCCSHLPIEHLYLYAVKRIAYWLKLN